MRIVDQRGHGPDDDAVRRLVQAVADTGWDCADGEELLRTLEQRCRAWAPAVDRHCGLRAGTTDPAELLATAWEIVDRYAERLAAADSPCAYLWNAVRNAAAVEAAGSALQISASSWRRMGRCGTVLAPVRVGADVRVLDQQQVEPGLVGPGSGVTDRWSPALRALLDLVVARGGDRRFWADAIDRAVEVMADARRSYEEHTLRRDPYLRLVLGLHPDQLSTLGALLVGTRRGDRSRQSLLLALHRDLHVDPAAVPGAEHRLHHLLDDRRADATGRPQSSSPDVRQVPGVA